MELIWDKRIIDRPAFWQRRATTHRFLTNIFAAI
ncbi:hypothetical protein BDE02_01G223400 [Populus trichocarpa]|nr:hypothetical protein BDE02_01G223400 [Populus trichocarpa]